MTNTCNAIGAFAKLIVQGGSGPRTFTDSSERYAFAREDISPVHGWAGEERNVGDLENTDSAGYLNSTMYAGTILMEGSRYNIEKWLPRAMTSTETSSPWGTGPSQDENEFDILINRENGMFHYRDCLVMAAVLFSDSENSISMLAVTIVAKDAVLTTPWPSPEPPLDITDASIPYVHFEMDFTFNSVPIAVDRIVTTVRNMLMPVANSSITAQKFRSRGRTVTCSVVGAMTVDSLAESEASLNSSPDAILIYSNPVLGDVILDFTNFSNSGHKHPVVQEKGSIPLVLQLQAGREGLVAPQLTLTTTP